MLAAAASQRVTVDGKEAAPVSGYGESHARIESPAPDFTAEVCLLIAKPRDSSAVPNSSSAALQRRASQFAQFYRALAGWWRWRQPEGRV